MLVCYALNLNVINYDVPTTKYLNSSQWRFLLVFCWNLLRVGKFYHRSKIHSGTVLKGVSKISRV